MQDQPTSPVASGSNRIPTELMEKLAEANAKFSEGKHHLEAELDSYEPDREHRLERRRAELRDAETQVEAAAEKIHAAISDEQPSV